MSCLGDINNSISVLCDLSVARGSPHRTKVYGLWLRVGKTSAKEQITQKIGLFSLLQQALITHFVASTQCGRRCLFAAIKFLTFQLFRSVPYIFIVWVITVPVHGGSFRISSVIIVMLQPINQLTQEIFRVQRVKELIICFFHFHHPCDYPLKWKCF